MAWAEEEALDDPVELDVGRALGGERAEEAAQVVVVLVVAAVGDDQAPVVLGVEQMVETLGDEHQRRPVRQLGAAEELGHLIGRAQVEQDDIRRHRRAREHRDDSVSQRGRDGARPDPVPLDLSVGRPGVLGEHCVPAVTELRPVVLRDGDTAEGETVVVADPAGLVQEEQVHSGTLAPMTNALKQCRCIADALRMSVVELMRLRYPSSCAICRVSITAGSHAHWDRTTKRATCAPCANQASPSIDRGSPGASATREWERRHSGREKRVRQTFGRLGGIVHALTDDPQSTTAWAIGARGERQLGVALDVLLQGGLEVLHDRRIPGSRANIDHLVIGPGGVYVVDAKRYEGKVEHRIVGNFFNAQRRLFVGNRDRSKLVAAVRQQAGLVRMALESIGRPEIPITPVLCFVESEWRLFAKPIRFDDVHVLWPKALGQLVREPGPLDPAAIHQLAVPLAGALPQA